jgi:hypothetical protein
MNEPAVDTREVNVQEFVNQPGVEEQPKEQAPIDPTIRTLLDECKRLTKERDDAVKETEQVQAEVDKLTDMNNRLADKLISYHLDPDDLSMRPAEEDIQEYARSVFGGNVFTKTFTVAGNNTIILSTLTDEEGEITSKIMSERIAKSEEEGTDINVATMEIFKLRMLWHIRGINPDAENGETYEFPQVTTLEEAEAEYNKRFRGKSDSFQAIMIRCIKHHTDLVMLLSNAIFDENFWKGAGLR